LQDRKKQRILRQLSAFCIFGKKEKMTGKRGITGLAFVMVLLVFASCQKTISGNGVVMAKDTGLPVKGASIDAYLEHPSPDTWQMHTVTDAAGRYFVSSDPQVCSGNCPEIYVKIVKAGYRSEYVKGPHNDTTWLVPGSR